MLWWIHNLRINRKLWINAGVGLTSLFLIWLFILYINRTTRDSFAEVASMVKVSEAADDTAAAVRHLAEPGREALADWNVVVAQRELDGSLAQYREQFDRLKVLVKEEDERVRSQLVRVEEGVSGIVALTKEIFRLADEKVAAESRGKLIGAQAAIEKAIAVAAEMNRVSREASDAMDMMTMILRGETTKIFQENVAVNQRLSLLSSFLFLASGAVTFFVSYVIAKSVAVPVGRLHKAVDAIGKGDLNHQVDLQGQDEISTFARSFSEMVGDLRHLVSEIQRGSRQIASTSEELSASSQQMGANSEETERLAGTVASASEQTNRNVQAVATAAEQMTATLEEISKNVAKSTRITSQAVQVAASANRTIGKLGDSSAEIGKIVSVITAIAQQTNLLALNASIEAARAGEAGKGFAVVANEVKDLAKKTAGATEEIGQKISMIQSDTNEAVSAIIGISGIIAQVNEIATAIAGALEEQTAATGEINQNMAQAARGTGEVTQSIGGVVIAAKSTAEGAARILEVSEKLAKMGADLMTLVNRFHVESGSSRVRDHEKKKEASLQIADAIPLLEERRLSG